MFAILNISVRHFGAFYLLASVDFHAFHELIRFVTFRIQDIPAVYLTARDAVYCVVALYLALIFCFPAWCYLDVRRQNAGCKDIFFWSKATKQPRASPGSDIRQRLLYDKFFRPLVLGSTKVRIFTHSLIWLTAAALFIVGCYGITQRKVGLGMEDGFPSNTQAHLWATERTESLASLNVEMNWVSATHFPVQQGQAASLSRMKFFLTYTTA
jgi:hypothetical protein